MRVLWGRVVVAVMAVILLVILIKYFHPIAGFLTSMEHIGPGYSNEEQARGAVAFGLVCILIVALVKILTHPNRE